MTTKPTQHPPRHKVTPISAAIKDGLETASPSPIPRQKTTYIPRPLQDEGVVRLPSVLAFLGISKTSFLDGVKAGKFPPGKLLTPRCRVWDVAAIRALVAEAGDE
jgi:predicted DNA-binding transcriptional regulator AlpA